MRKNNKGFTLIELLIVVSLLTIAVGLTGDTLITIVRTFNKTTVKNEIEQNANFVSQKMVKELRNAKRIEELQSGQPLVKGGSYNEVTFTVIDDENNENDVTYSIRDNIVYRTYEGNSEQPLTESNPPYGVTASCGSPSCFTLVETSPQVLRISIILTQAGTPGNKMFEGSIEIEDTIVIRDTY